MTPERWEQIRDVLGQVLEAEPNQRGAILERVGSSDPSLRGEVEVLLASSDDILSDFLQSPPEQIALEAGTKLGDYEIKALLGKGGMGEVYRARDSRLGRDVAIKVLPAFFSSDPGRLRRFELEARAAAALTHPNILGIFQMGTYEGAPYLVSELLEGETLRARLEHGRLTTAESINYGVQIANGLSAAHEKGIVHRDLKPENLFLTRDRRLKILDFGLAKLTQHDTTTTLSTVQSTATRPGALIGTVGYMSPEQVRGQNTDQRTDIFTFGAILYEMASGKRAFHGPTPADTMSAILTQDPPSLSETSQDIPAPLQDMVRSCLEKNPDKRIRSASELASALDTLSHELRHGQSDSAARALAQQAAPASSSASAPGMRRAAVLAATLVVLLAAGSVAVWQVRRINARKSGASVKVPVLKPRRSIAVLDVKNLSGRPDETWLETAFPEMLTTELAEGEQLRTVSGEDVAKMKADLSLPSAGSYSKDTLTRIHKRSGADEVIVGSFVPVEAGEVRVDLRLQDTAAGDISDVVSAKGSTQQLDELVSRLGSSLRQKLGVPQISGQESAEVRASLPQNSATQELYAEGLRFLRLYQFPDAKRVLEKAVAFEPQFSLGHSALASAYRGLGQDAQGQQEAKKAFDLSTNLPREKRLWIEGQYYAATRQWAKAIESYKTLFDFFPDNLDYGLRLASAQTASGHGKDALATVDLLRKLPAPDSENPIIDLSEAVAAGSLGDFTRQHEAAARSIQKADAQGAHLMAAQARISDCSALHDLGKPDDALAVCEEAKRTFEQAGDRGGATRALLNIGVIWQEAGELTKARKTDEEGLAAIRLVGDKRVEGILINNLAEIQGAQGDLEASLKTLDQEKKIAEIIGSKRFLEFALFNTGTDHAVEGKLQQARNDYGEALKVIGEVGDKSGQATVLAMIGDLDLLADDLPSARKNYEESLAIRTTIGENRTVPESQLALATLLVEEKKLAEAESAAQKSAAALQEVHSDEEAAVAFAVLSRALREEGKIDAARSATERAALLLKKDGDLTARLRVEIESARVRAASGKPEDVAAAAKSLKSSLDQASRKGLVGLQLEARLVLGEIEIKTNDPKGGRLALAKLQRDSQERGFLLDAHKAEAILQAPGNK